MKKELKYFNLFDKILHECSEVLKDECFLSFLFNKKKKAYESGSFDTKVIAESVGSIMEKEAKKIFNLKKMYVYFFNQRDGHRFLLSKVPLVKYEKRTEEYWGDLFGIPKCCVKQYIKDGSKQDSFQSAIRYNNQLYDGKIKDEYEVLLFEGSVSCTNGFIPCHPNCKEARKVLNIIKKAKEDVKALKNFSRELKGGNEIMPITRDQYERGDFKQRATSNDDYVLEFLKKNGNYAYTPDEIAKAVNRSSSIVRQKLRNLLKKGLVERKVPRYIVSKKLLKSSSKKKTKKK